MGRRKTREPVKGGYCVKEYSPLHDNSRFCASNVSRTEADEHRAVMEITYPENVYTVVPNPKGWKK